MCGVHPNDCDGIDDYFKDKVMLPIAGKVYKIDRCIHHIIAALNAGGVNTIGCCCGHGKDFGYIQLEDGRVLNVYQTLEESRANTKTPRCGEENGISST